MTPQEQQIENIKEFLKVAKTRSGLPHKLQALQTDLTGNPSGIRGSVEVLDDKGGTVSTNVIWEWNGRYPMNPMLDLIVEQPLALFSDQPPTEEEQPQG